MSAIASSTSDSISEWQTERTCRNFEELSDWLNEWGITRKEALHNHDLAENFVDEGDGVQKCCIDYFI
ncbi:unnamed protein product [Alternaria sp. RS040]